MHANLSMYFFHIALLCFVPVAAMSSPQLHIQTPLIESYELSKQAGTTVYLKLENTQPSYTFKLRGIGNLITKVAKLRNTE